jgi:SagB-type dehydrogenase family enzyme
MAAHGVTVWNSVPALLELVVEYLEAHPEAAPTTLRLVLLSGDWIPLALADRLRALCPAARVISLGGATEAAIWSIFHPIETVDPGWRSIPYGRPLKNQRFHVLDRQLEPCPTWVAGQIYIAGAGLARGYWRDPEKTAASFLLHPRTGERLYRTGDWGRYLPGGDIEFLGRQDQQVKIQGYRIELGEIEAALRCHEAVSEAVVLAPGEPREGRRLVGYVLCDRGLEEAARPSEGALRAHLTESLPEYMVPSRIVVLDHFPLTANGKVDRGALPLPEGWGRRAVAAVSTAATAVGSGADSEAITERIAALVAEVIEVSPVPPEADLLELGVSSLQMVRIANALEGELDFRPRLEGLYLNPTVAELAKQYREHLMASGGAAAADSADSADSAETSDVLPAQTPLPLILLPDERDAFKATQPGLRHDLETLPAVTLPGVEQEAAFEQWRSHRHFSLAPIPQARLGGWLAGLRQGHLNGDAKYLFASAGGVYPVQTYLHLQSGRVEGIEGGFYHYDPVAHRLVVLAPGAELPRHLHEPFLNRPVFDRAAFSVFFIARLAAIQPLYGAAARDFCLIEAGSMVQLLRASAPSHGLGFCSMGALELSPVRDLLRLDARDELVHSLLGGGVDDQSRAAWQPLRESGNSGEVRPQETEDDEREEFEL